MGKLDNTQKAAIYQSWKDGTSPKELAKQYAISIQAIYQLINKLNRASAEVFGADLTQAPESTIETGAISSVVLADTTVEQNHTESADAVQPITEIERVAEPVAMTKEHTAETSSIPQVVAYAVEDRIANIMGYVEKLEEKRAALERAIDTLQQDISGYKAEIEELRAWMGSHTIAGDA